MLYSEKMKEICEKLGIDCSKLPNNLYSTLLDEICNCCGSGGSKNEPITITENGTYTAPEGVGYSPVEVNVSGSGEDMLQTRVNATNSCKTLFENYEGTTVDYIANLDTSNVTNMESMFRSCKALTSIPLLNTSNVTSMGYMFYDCTNLTAIPELDTSNVTNMSRMFNGCRALTAIPELDTSNVTNTEGMFSSCEVLTSIPLLNTSNVTNMGYMFTSCRALTTIPALDVSNVTNMSSIFNNCYFLKSILMYGMKVNFSINLSTKFEREDLVTILNNLATVTTTQTLTMGSTNLAKLTDEDKLIATNKGWTLA